MIAGNNNFGPKRYLVPFSTHLTMGRNIPCNGLTLYFTKKAILEQVIIPKGTILGNSYAIGQLQE